MEAEDMREIKGAPKTWRWNTVLTFAQETLPVSLGDTTIMGLKTNPWRAFAYAMFEERILVLHKRNDYVLNIFNTFNISR